MRETLIAGAMLLLTTSVASAYCAAPPDDADTHYVQNSTAHTLCLQKELAETTQQMVDQARIEAEINNLRITLDQQQRTFEPLWLDD